MLSDPWVDSAARLAGSERWGISEEAQELVDVNVNILCVGMVQSLNVSVAAATLLFEAARQRRNAGLVRHSLLLLLDLRSCYFMPLRLV